MTLLASTAHAILNEALASDYGITVECQSIGDLPTPSLRAKQILYRFMSDNSDFANFQIRFSPDDPDNELWIIKNP